MKEKILIVEGNPMHMKLVEMTLRTKNYTLLKANDGEEVLDMVIRKQPNLIIMDINLSGMTGFEVSKKLRENPAFNHTPIIAITAYAMKGDMEKIIEAGCDVYLPKPIDTRELPIRVAEMLLGRQKLSDINGDGNE